MSKIVNIRAPVCLHNIISTILLKKIRRALLIVNWKYTHGAHEPPHGSSSICTRLIQSYRALTQARFLHLCSFQRRCHRTTNSYHHHTCTNMYLSLVECKFKKYTWSD